MKFRAQESSACTAVVWLWHTEAASAWYLAVTQYSDRQQLGGNARGKNSTMFNWKTSQIIPRIRLEEREVIRCYVAISVLKQHEELLLFSFCSST